MNIIPPKKVFFIILIVNMHEVYHFIATHMQHYPLEVCRVVVWEDVLNVHIM